MGAIGRLGTGRQDCEQACGTLYTARQSQRRSHAPLPVQTCITNGVVQGYDDGKYHPEYEVTGDQMAVYVARAFELPM